MAMKILSVIPILRGVAPDILSYYTGLQVQEGALIEVPIRKRHAPALVVRVEDVKESTSDIRRAAYALKKAKRVLSPHALPQAVLATAAYLADYYAAPLGAVLYAVIPQSLISAPGFLRVLGMCPQAGHRPDAASMPRAIQLPYDERLSRYKSIIRQSFARKRSIIVITPTRAQADELHARLSKGIEDHAFLIASALTPKQQRERWEAAMLHEEPVLVVGTMLAASIWRSDISHYILEHESSPYYKSSERPFIDARIAVATLAAAAGAELIFGDTYLRIETLAKTFTDEYEELLKPQMHQPTSAAVTLIDMREVPPFRGESPVLSPQSEDAMMRTIREHGKTFIYATRKGHTPLTLCRDCGTVLTCDRCDAPMVLYSARNTADIEARRFECHRCGRIRDAKTMCTVCGGWRLYAYGMGVEKISEVLKTHKKEVPVFLLSNDTAKSHTEAQKITAAWEESQHGVLVGTVRALPYLRHAPPTTSVVASFDTLLMLPDIYMQERLFGLLSFMREITEKRLVVQTRSPEQETLRQALSGDGLAFFKGEDGRRKLFGYPPYGVPIKITLQGKEQDVLSHLTVLKERFAPYPVSVYPAFVSKVKGHFIGHALFSVPTHEWPSKDITEILRTLPPVYRVEISPESLL
jgi:primosomal protein N'